MQRENKNYRVAEIISIMNVSDRSINASAGIFYISRHCSRAQVEYFNTQSQVNYATYDASSWARDLFLQVLV